MSAMFGHLHLYYFVCWSLFVGLFSDSTRPDGKYLGRAEHDGEHTEAHTVSTVLSGTNQYKTATADSGTSAATVTGRPAHDGKHTSIKVPIDIPCNEYVCTCSRKKREAFCSGRNFKLRYIPRVPAYIRHFRLWTANISSLNRHKLQNVSNFDLEVINLKQNRIESLANDTFVDFRKLRSLDIGENPISAEMLHDAFYSIHPKPFKLLRLDNMKLGPILPTNFLDALTNHSLHLLSLQGNELTHFDIGVFSRLREVTELFLSNNTIQSFVLNGTARILLLKMENNYIPIMPDFCRPDGKPAVPWLLSLYMRNNPLKKIPSTALKGRCLPTLSKLDISGSTALSLEDNFIADLPFLHTLMAERMRLLELYGPFCFNSTSLKKLLLNHNRLWIRGVVHPTHVFAHSPNLENLQMIATKINLPDDLFAPLLLSLKSVKILRLQSCSLGSIPSDTLWRLPRLTELDLTGNRINAFTMTSALQNVSGLEVLILQGNNINTVNESTIPPGVLRSVKTLDLGRNPFDCTCSLLWFKSWVKQEAKNGSIRGWPIQYICSTPARWKHTRLIHYNPSYRECHPVSVPVIVGGVSGGFLFLLTFTISIIYRYRWYLRYYIYRLRRRLQYQSAPHSSNLVVEPFMFSIYLAYSEGDIEWVMAEMLPLLETDAKLRVFLKNRDIVGGTVADNIVSNMDLSERVLLVLSDAYTREGWSGYEFQHVLFASMEQGKDVIVVLKDDLEAGRMTKDMRRMLTRGTFLQWAEAQEARLTFRDGLMVALGTGGSLQEIC